MKNDPDPLIESLADAARARSAYRLTKLVSEAAARIREPVAEAPEDYIRAMREAVQDRDVERLERLAHLQAEYLRNEVYTADDLATDPISFVGALEDAVESFDRKRAGELCDQLVVHLRHHPQQYDFQSCKQILGLLRNKRYFDLILEVADVMIQTGRNEPRIRRTLAQALLDEGHLTAGLDVLHVLEHDCEGSGDHGELAEARGLIGRAHKQAYINANKEGGPAPELKKHLASAIDSYARVYDEDPEKTWQGINSVALQRLGADKLPKEGEEIARKIIKKVEARRKAARKEGKDVEHWDLATAGEASIALDNPREALEWITEYTKAGKADAFEYASTLRQFEEVWHLDNEDPKEAPILQLLRSALLRQEGGQLRLKDPAQELQISRELAANPEFEAVLGTDLYRSFSWYRTGLSRAAGVAKILNSAGNGHGTGFLLRGSDLHSNISDPWVLVTNAHVLSLDPGEQSGNPAALPPDQASIKFEGRDSVSSSYRAKEILFSSGRFQLDCTIVTLSEIPDFADPYPIAPNLPASTPGEARPRAFVIGHPGGGELSLSMHDNVLLAYGPPKIHYRSPTKGGSSGSPVFNDQWQLIALHHAGSSQMSRLDGKPGTYAANEGIWILNIIKALRDKFG